MALEIKGGNGNITINGLDNFDLEATFECGQCFRWERLGPDDYIGVAGGRALRISREDGSYVFHGCTKEDFDGFWEDYLDLGTDYKLIIDKLSENDPVMKRATDFAPGIRIIRQPLFETLISFIISANNSIPNIKRIISRLSEAYGEKIIYMGKTSYSFPGPESLAAADESEVRQMKAGFRSPYIIKTSEMFLQQPLNTADLKPLGYEAAKRELMKYPGIGSKVADCTLLFSGTFTNAFPVDVWVRKIMEEYYVDKGTPLEKISDFAKEKFGNLGGYAQQYLFYYARSNM